MLLQHGRICALQLVIIIHVELNRDQSWRVVGVSMKSGPLVLSVLKFVQQKFLVLSGGLLC